MRKPNPNEIYRHFKGNLYRVVTLARHTETDEELVVYQALYGDYAVYARPLSMFLSPVDKAKYPEAGQENRFELLSAFVGQESMMSAPKVSQGSMQSVPEPKVSQGSMQSVPEPEVSQGSVQSVPEPSETENAAQKVSEAVSEAGEDTSSALDPLVLEFLDADTYEQKLNILAALHHRITDDMINTMAVATDVEVAEGDIEERYAALRTCLLTLDKYECSRLQ